MFNIIMSGILYKIYGNEMYSILEMDYNFLESQ
jgi:hypothetical protein